MVDDNGHGLQNDSAVEEWKEAVSTLIIGRTCVENLDASQPVSHLLVHAAAVSESLCAGQGAGVGNDLLHGLATETRLFSRLMRVIA